MNEANQIIDALKRQLRAQGLTYRDVAKGLKLSEPSVKRLFASGRFTVDRLVQVSQLLGFTLAELVQESANSVPPLHMLTQAQEAQLVSSETLLLVTVCALNHWTVDDIVATYRITRAECLKHLLRLDRIGLIALQPGDRIRLCVARDFDWLPGGPIRQYFLEQGLNDFLDCRFERDDETLAFTHGMLTPAAAAELRLELRRLRSKFAALHQESMALPLAQKRGTGLLLALREWEPRGFARLRRNADARKR
ncbi:helix-turn-helix domain-containing protein [Ralstonia sp. UBA689]|uniref:helix-turn-helix domain-containing protein n=1 Tax=Ralstonia sp. UBA689 TaxID=1947373 RepID=UPI0025EE30E7|nr:helix-turn-helix transcriptional regulator [Ralstonia sp. UBA689]